MFGRTTGSNGKGEVKAEAETFSVRWKGIPTAERSFKGVRTSVVKKSPDQFLYGRPYLIEVRKTDLHWNNEVT